MQFGRLGEGFKTYYGITVRFPDASGLLKGSDVLLAGAKIGPVSGGAAPGLGRAGRRCAVAIYDYVKIPVDSSITVGSSGLLGDRFVAVFPPAAKPTAYIAKGARIEGTREKGLDDITKEGGALMQGSCADGGEDRHATVSRLNDQALSKENMEHLTQTFDNLSAGDQGARRIVEEDRWRDRESRWHDGLGGRRAADKVQLAVGDARKTIQAATQVMSEATPGGLARDVADERSSWRTISGADQQPSPPRRAFLSR